MKITCLQENLRLGLTIATRAVSSRSTLPIYEHVLLTTTHDGYLRLSGNNGEMGITCSVGAQVKEQGGVTIPAKLLKDFVDSLPAERVSLSLSEKTMSLRLTCGRFKSTIKGQPADDFPAIVTPTDDCASIALEAAQLVDAISMVTLSAAQDESRPILKGTRLTFEGGKLFFAAADGFRMSLKWLEIENSQAIEDSGIFADSKAVIIPSDTLEEVARAAKGFDGLVEFLVSPDMRRVFFRVDEILITSQLFEGEFPDIERIIPPSHATQTKFEKDLLLSTAKVNHLFARESANIVVVTVDQSDEVNGVTMSAQSSELGENEAFMEADIEGDDIEIAFNCKYMLDVLNVISEPEVILETNKPGSPGVFRVVKDGEIDDSFTYVIMPMQITKRT